MFILVGIHAKIRDCGAVSTGRCPVCGRTGALHITNKYMTPHVLYIPTFRFNNEYIAACGGCASILRLHSGKGRALERGERVEILPNDLRLLRSGAAPACPRCGNRQPRGGAVCRHCGNALRGG